jgi:alanine dehydrogenase
MKIGIIKEGKNPPDKRVPYTPEQCKGISARYPDVELLIQKSEVRAFNDNAYEKAGLKLVDSLEDAEVIFGVKEVNLEDLQADKTYFFFSHTIKEQPYNRELLQTVLKRNIKLIDYECLTNRNGQRLAGFGRYAGVVGCFNAFLAFGKRSGTYDLKPAHECDDRMEMEFELPKIKLPNDFRIALTGTGRVAGGANEILEKMQVRKVSSKDYLEQEFDEPVYTQLDVNDYYRKPDSSSFENREVYSDPSDFESDFMKFAEKTDLYIPCHFWDSNGPRIFTEEELASNKFRIRTIADISCDIAGPIPSTIRPATIADPIYQVNRHSLEETDQIDEENITVMAVDNLPCELPKDASEDFGAELIDKVLPNLIGSDKDAVIDRATIAERGELKPDFEYLKGYVSGE